MKDNKIPVSQEIKTFINRHLVDDTLIVAAGICIALGQVLGGTDVGEKQEQSRGCLIRLAAGEWG